MHTKSILLVTILAALASPVGAAITGVTETGLGADTPAIIATGFGEDTLTFSDRTHQHNGAAFAAGTNLLSTTGTTIIDLPDYLVGGEYVRFANDARENAGYSATVIADVPTIFYLLLDNRVNGPAGNASSSNTTDPVLGGTLQWVIDGGWQRVDTGISPNGQADYCGVDEGGNGVGPGVALNQFYSVWRLPDTAASATVSNNGTGGSNMVAVVAIPAPDPGEPIGSFTAGPLTISEGQMATLSWIIHANATVATIDQGVGNVLPQTTNGVGSTMVQPAVTTTYTLSVESPGGNEQAQASVTVRMVDAFAAGDPLIAAGESVTLSWTTRSDATVTIDNGVGAVPAGSANLMVSPLETTTYTLTAVSGAEMGQATASVFVMPPGDLYALLDIGATGGTPEAGALDGAQLGAAVAGTNATNLPVTPLVSESGDSFTVAIDNIDPGGVALGALDWRDRGASTGDEWTFLGEDLVKNNAGMVRVTLGSLPAGTYDVLSWHFDPTFSQSESIRILVTDANGTAADTGVIGSAFAAPTITSLNNTTANMVRHTSRFSVTSDGVNDVVVYFDGTAAADDETPLNGLRISLAGPPVPLRIVDIRYDADAGSVTIEFASRAGRFYAIFASNDLEDFLEELDDSIEGQDETTEYTEFGVDPSVVPNRFYRVQEL